jgi:2,3-bisphosphoglycerate-dependent phosphoglycerate mutase
MQIFVIRHAETSENRTGIVQGHLPGHLTERGQQQARELGLKLVEHGPFDQIVSSDLDRAKETADLISREIPPCRIAYDERLRERCYGPLDGQPLFRLKRLLVENKTDLRGLAVAGGEDYGHFERRVMECFGTLTSGAPDRKIILVTHAGVIQVLFQRMPGMPGRDIGNCEAFRILVTADRDMQFRPL